MRSREHRYDPLRIQSLVQAQQAQPASEHLTNLSQLESGVENLMQNDEAAENERKQPDVGVVINDESKDSGGDIGLAANQNQQIPIPNSNEQIEYTFASPPRAPQPAQRSRHRIKAYSASNEVLDSMFPDAFDEHGLSRDRFTEYYSQQLRVIQAFDREDGHFILRDFDHKKGVWSNGYHTVFPRPDSDMLWCRCDQFGFDSKTFVSTATFGFATGTRTSRNAIT